MKIQKLSDWSLVHNLNVEAYSIEYYYVTTAKIFKGFQNKRNVDANLRKINQYKIYLMQHNEGRLQSTPVTAGIMYRIIIKQKGNYEY